MVVLVSLNVVIFAPTSIFTTNPYMPQQQYSASSIQVLEFPTSVRKRPGMYIGSTTIKGLHHLVYEVVDNAIDEATAGYCTEIHVEIRPDEVISVQDNGRGIPVGIHPKENRSALEVIMTTLHAGGKFDKDSYAQGTSGLHGVGVSCVNALAEWLVATVHRDGKVFEQSYSKGVKQSGVEEKGRTEEKGTRIVFKPDPTIFETTVYDYNIIAARLRELSFLNPGLRICLIDLRRADEEGNYRSEVFFAEKGLAAFVMYLEGSRTSILPQPITAHVQKKGMVVDVAMMYNSGHKENIFSYANNIKTFEGGTHLMGLKKGITRALKVYGEREGIFEKAKVTPSGDDFREGATVVLSVKVPEPQFSGQEKTRLTNPEVAVVVDHAVNELLTNYLEENPQSARLIMSKVVLASQARQAAKRARDLVQGKKALQAGALPGKLADCSEKDPSKRELIILEGNSAGGNAKQARRRDIQAILPLRGKILNIEKAQEHKIYESEQIRNIITALGVSFEETEEGRVVNLDKLRYHRIIIMTDADVDGSHIRTLVLTLFFRFMPALITKGYVYIALPPLFLVQKGNVKRYCWTEEERDEHIKALEGMKVKGKGDVRVQRYKGIGEMNPEQLWETTLNPDNRILKQVEVSSDVEADRLFSVLMGDDIPPRRALIEKYAKDVAIEDLG